MGCLSDLRRDRRTPQSHYTSGYTTSASAWGEENFDFQREGLFGSEMLGIADLAPEASSQFEPKRRQATLTATTALSLQAEQQETGPACSAAAATAPLGWVTLRRAIMTIIATPHHVNPATSSVPLTPR